MTQPYTPFMFYGYVLVSGKQCFGITREPCVVRDGYCTTHTPKPAVITVLVIKDTHCNARGQNATHIYLTRGWREPTLLRAVRRLAGHNPVKLNFLNMACCTADIGYCHCHGLGVNL